MISTITSTSRLHASTWVAATSTCVQPAHDATAMWSKQVPLAAAPANRNKGAMGAPGLWDPV